MRGRIHLVALLCVWQGAVAARAAPDAVEGFFKELAKDEALGEVYTPADAQLLPFAIRTLGGQTRVVRVAAAPKARRAAPLFGEPGPWLLVYDPQGRRVIHAQRIAGEPQAHFEAADPTTGRWRGQRIASPVLRERLRLPILGRNELYVGRSTTSIQTLSTVDSSTAVASIAGCPAVVQVLGSAPTGTAVNLLVVPSGFETEDDLDLFRCATHRLFTQLLASNTPFGSLASNINVFRMDLPDTQAGTIAETLGCDASPVDWEHRALDCSERALWEGRTVVPAVATAAAAPSWGIPLENLSAGSSACNKVFLTSDGQTIAESLADCATQFDFDAIVVLVNSGARFGGGDWAPTTPMLVASLPRIAESDAWLLLGHELGHALGLLDEYEEGTGPSYTTERNIVSRDEIVSASGFLWDDACVSTVDGSAVCGSSTLNGTCEVVGKSPVPTGCCTSTPAALATSAAIGLWEGGHYQACGYFRSRQLCLMGDFSLLSFLPEHPFCPACERRITSQLGTWGSGASGEDYDTYATAGTDPSGLGIAGPPVFSTPPDWAPKPPRAGELRTLVRTRYGTAVIDPDVIDARVKRPGANGGSERCRVVVTKGNPLRCNTTCEAAPPSGFCGDAVSALVGRGSELVRARAVKGDQRFEVQGIRIRRRH